MFNSSSRSKNGWRKTSPTCHWSPHPDVLLESDRSLPLEYSANAKAWMTGDLFSPWLEKWNRKLASKNRHELLVPCHGVSSHLDAMNCVDERVCIVSYISVDK